ncbi:MAG: ABC transporter ATP-binding protein, partial [Clostridia bacterium]|nr:ABC transporter ATP-binding protein [Clostridia bacterium]
MSRPIEELRKRYSHYAKAEKVHGMMGGPRRRGPGNPGEGGKKIGKEDLARSRATIRRIFGYLSGYKIHLLFVIFFMLLSTAASLLGSYLMRPVINNIADSTVPAETRIAYLIQIILTIAAVYLVGVFCTYMQSRLMLKISTNSIERLRSDLFSKMQKLPLRYFDANTTGDIMSRYTSDVDNIETMVNNTITSLISGVITIAGTIGLMFYANVWLALLTVLFVPLFAFLGARIAKASGKYYKGQQDALGAVNGYVEETVTGAKVVKVFNHEGVCGEEFSLLNNDLRDKQFKAQFYGSIMGPVVGNASQIAYAVTAGVGALLCVFGGFDVGGLTFFCNNSRHFSMPINNISQQMTTIFAALAGAERVFNVMDMPPETDSEEAAEPSEALKGDVILENVSFGYYPDRLVLKNISLYAHPGQKIAFVGSTGAGKTTVTNLLNRFYDIEQGSITVDGIDIRKIPRDTLRKNIAMVLQDTHLFSGTIRENIRYGRLDATDEEVEQAA